METIPELDQPKPPEGQVPSYLQQCRFPLLQDISEQCGRYPSKYRATQKGHSFYYECWRNLSPHHWLHHLREFVLTCKYKWLNQTDDTIHRLHFCTCILKLLTMYFQGEPKALLFSLKLVLSYSSSSYIFLPTKQKSSNHGRSSTVVVTRRSCLHRRCRLFAFCTKLPSPKRSRS